MSIEIDLRPDEALNNTGRFHFIAQEHSFHLLSFLEESEESLKLHIDKDEVEKYEKLFNDIKSDLLEHVFPAEQIQSLISDIQTRCSICELEGMIPLTVELCNAIHDLDNEQKSYLFNLFQLLISNSENLTDCLIENNLLENICTFILSENASDMSKIAPIKCIHFIARNGKAKKIFDDISFSYKDKPKRASPFECMLELLHDQNQDQDPDDALGNIRKCNGPSFETDEHTIELRYLILKFIVVILKYKDHDLPRYSADEIVKHIIDITIQYSESVIIGNPTGLKFLDNAIFGCHLAAENKYTKACFLSYFKETNGIMNFINILKNNKDYKEYKSITPAILLCIKSIADSYKEEVEYFYKYNIVKSIAIHIKNDEYPLVCENAIQTLISLFKADKKSYFESFIEENVIEILYDNLENSCFLVKVTSMIAISEIIKDLNESTIFDFICDHNEIFERICSLLLTEIKYDIYKAIIETALILADAYNKVGKNEELLDIVKKNDIDSTIDNFLEADNDSKIRILAQDLKRRITLEEKENM